jgi:hypothetical protein
MSSGEAEQFKQGALLAYLSNSIDNINEDVISTLWIVIVVNLEANNVQ